MTGVPSALAQAQRHVKRVRDFSYHLMTYVLVNLLLIVVDSRAGAGDQAFLGLDWAYWVVIFWGFGIVGHAVYAFFDDYRASRLAGRTS